MRFRTQPNPLLRILEMLADSAPGVLTQKQRVTLVALQDRLWMLHSGTAARMEAIIFEEGQCTVSAWRFLRALEPHRDSRSVTVDADARSLKLGQVSIPVRNYSTAAIPPARFQIFLATDLGIVPSVSVPLQLVSA